ncbi:MAG: hypothetical protein B7Y61_18255, partial [Rhizobiales bacterium 35-66-30]
LAARRHAARVKALELFHAHGLHQTEARNGLLIFVAPRDRLVEIVADEGVQAAIPHEAWISLCGAVVERAGEGALAEGIAAAVTQAGALLAPHLPAVPGDKNELSDRVGPGSGPKLAIKLSRSLRALDARRLCGYITLHFHGRRSRLSDRSSSPGIRDAPIK